MSTKAHKLVWPKKMLEAFDGVLVSVGEREFHKVRAQCESLALSENIFEGLYEIYLQIATWMNESIEAGKPLWLIGLNGAQGTGKSTAAVILKTIFECCYNKKVCILSMDDIYLTRRERADLARNVHPLLVTRGVPGTHDLTLGLQILETLKTAGENSRTKIPVFDKSNDDRLREDRWKIYTGKPDLVILEGWCVSALPQSDDMLKQAINELERLHDHDGVWRRFVNRQLVEYQALFDKIEYLIMLKVPGFYQVYEWRLLQEKKLKQAVESVGKRSRAIMDEDQIRWFIEHFERLTRWMLDEMSKRADLVLGLNEAHRITSVALNSES